MAVLDKSHSADRDDRQRQSPTIHATLPSQKASRPAEGAQLDFGGQCRSRHPCSCQAICAVYVNAASKFQVQLQVFFHQGTSLRTGLVRNIERQEIENDLARYFHRKFFVTLVLHIILSEGSSETRELCAL